MKVLWAFWIIVFVIMIMMLCVSYTTEKVRVCNETERIIMDGNVQTL